MKELERVRKSFILISRERGAGSDGDTEII